MSAETIQTIANIATAIGVAVAAWQLIESRRQVQSQFEDKLLEHYREISRRLPLDALLGRPLASDDLNAALRDFYQYFDLSNEQTFLASRNRIRRATWANWKEGIEQHVNRPAFQQAWATLVPHLDGSFDALRELFPLPATESEVLTTRDGYRQPERT